MGIFGKKSSSPSNGDTERQGKITDSDSREDRTIKVKKIKDINSGNKKRRKEPIRAWNKFDRIVLLFFIIGSFGMSLYFALTSRGWKPPNFTQLNFPKINLLGERTVVLDSNEDNRKVSDELITDFIEETDDLNGVYGLYVVELDDNFAFGIHEDKIFQAASLIKLPVMVGMYMAEQDQSLSLSKSYKLKAEDKVKGSGTLYGKPVGYELTYRGLIKLMGQESDNTAFNICRKYLGDEKIKEIIDGIGMRNTSLAGNSTTAYDIGLLFHKLWDGELLNRKNSSELLDYMTDTIYESWLAAGVPDNVRISHKYGREASTVNDAGIVYADSPYIVVILSKEVVLREADNVFPRLSKAVYEGMKVER